MSATGAEAAFIAEVLAAWDKACETKDDGGAFVFDIALAVFHYRSAWLPQPSEANIEKAREALAVAPSSRPGSTETDERQAQA